MPTPKRLTAGIRPLGKMFRVKSLAGLIIDALYAARGTAPFDDDYFETLGEADTGFVIRNKASTNQVTVSVTDVVFVKDYYQTGHGSVEKFLDEFRAIWKIVDRYLEVRDIRRVGLVGEYRLKTTRPPSEELLGTITRFEEKGAIEKFHLRFETRTSKSVHERPLDDVGAFTNTIVEVYDSALDNDNPAKGAINANVDVQKYFSPLLRQDPQDELFLLRNSLRTESDRLLRLFAHLSEPQREGKQE